MSVVGRVGQNITLPCSYNTKRNVVRRVCWGRGDIPNSGCSKELISTDGLKEFTERRYQLRGWLDEGDVSLTILNLTESDAGRYGCRVHIPGLFNDEKHHVDLTIEEASVAQTTTETTRMVSTEAVHMYTAGQLTSTGYVKAEQEHRTTLVPVLVLLGLEALLIAAMVLMYSRSWMLLNTVPQQEVSSTVLFSLTPSTVQFHRRDSAVENINQRDGGEYTTVVYHLTQSLGSAH
ncbi:T-cell immunoglobulin and mucin domain-containing protein 4-like isoform X3 [Notolabrus celidotus]|uniref:T-cell immunoglobulin and mucin domain-containing protein 4-like isoform X3 n=1 Tax=Notolabrus celidotus TaxID=1203425 RepID=UPI00148FBF84|nr:T-cell immunoglobulin and mucin domain-containing protein 4-like isoform X3 [Notolabrus celidotus]